MSDELLKQLDELCALLHNDGKIISSLHVAKAIARIRELDKHLDKVFEDKHQAELSLHQQGEHVAALEAIVKAIEEYETLAKKSGCGDGNCVVWKPTGMHTNGGCACVRTASYDHSLRATIDQLLRIAQKAAGAAATVKGE